MFSYILNELSLRITVLNGTNELNERETKLPKMIKNSHCRLVARYDSRMSEFKSIGIIIISGKSVYNSKGLQSIIDSYYIRCQYYKADNGS